MIFKAKLTKIKSLVFGEAPQFVDLNRSVVYTNDREVLIQPLVLEDFDCSCVPVEVKARSFRPQCFISVFLIGDQYQPRRGIGYQLTDTQDEGCGE